MRETRLTNHAHRVVRLRHLAGGIQLGDNGDQRRLNNRNLRTGAHLTEKIDDVNGAHANAAVACWASDVPFFRCAVNINVATKCVRVLSFASAQPDDPRHNWITPGRVHRNYFAGTASIFENRSSRGAVTDFVCDFQLSERRAEASRAVAQSEFGSRNRIGGDQFFFFEEREFLIGNADDNVMFGVPWRGAGRENDCECASDNVPCDDLNLTRAQIGRILPQLRWLRQRFLPRKRGELARFPPRPIACGPARSVFRETGPAPDKDNPFRP